MSKKLSDLVSEYTEQCKLALEFHRSHPPSVGSSPRALFAKLALLCQLAKDVMYALIDEVPIQTESDQFGTIRSFVKALREYDELMAQVQKRSDFIEQSQRDAGLKDTEEYEDTMTQCFARYQDRNKKRIERLNGMIGNQDANREFVLAEIARH